MSLEIVLEDARWQDAGLAQLAETACAATLTELGITASIEGTVMGCDDARIAELNTEFRGKPKATNVLSWPSEDVTPPDLPHSDPDGTIPLGDIAISFDTCETEARASGKSLEHHATHLIIHGLLHLLGYDHIRDIDATVMEGIETRILGKLGISDPYSLI